MKDLHRVYRLRPPTKAAGSGPRGKAAAKTGLTEGSPTKSKSTMVGIWDLGSWVGYLDPILEAWNAGQKKFQFQRTFLSVPYQLTQGGARTVEIAKKLLDARRIARDRDELGDNFVFEEAEQIASRVRTDLHYEQLVSITPYMLAFMEGNEFHYSYYSVSHKGIIFVSTYGMRDYANAAKRPFEAAIGSLILSQVLADKFDGLEFHDETRGCLFDFNDARDTIVESLKTMAIEPNCFNLIPQEYRSAAQAMTDVLKSYRRKARG